MLFWKKMVFWFLALKMELYKILMSFTVCLHRFFFSFSAMFQQYHCCCNLRNATIIIGTILMITCFIALITAIIGLATNDRLERDAFNPEGKKTVETSDYLYALVVTLIILISSCCLVYGALKEKRQYIAPWLIATGVMIIMLLCGIIYSTVSSKNSVCVVAVLLAGQCARE